MGSKAPAGLERLRVRRGGWGEAGWKKIWEARWAAERRAAEEGEGGCSCSKLEFGTLFARAIPRRLPAKGEECSAAPMQGERWRKLGERMEAVWMRCAWVRVRSGGGGAAGGECRAR